MSKHLLIIAFIILLFSSCASTSRKTINAHYEGGEANLNVVNPSLPAGILPDSLNKLASTQDGGFVLETGLYEAEFKTYCLEPGTPDPSPRDAYLQSPVTGFHKEIVECVLLKSSKRLDVKQRNVQLLLWSVVSNSNYNNLPTDVRADAGRLLTSKQIFELKGGWMNVARMVSNNIPSGNGGIKRLFERGADSYEKYEKIAVLSEPSHIHRPDFKLDQWYQQKDGYYVRYFPVSYKSVRMQVYVPAQLLDSTGKLGGRFVVFDPTGTQVIPANCNAQRLGVGGTVIDIIRKIIIVDKENKQSPKRIPEKKKEEKAVRKKGSDWDLL
ncbi:MAG TPA: hypothetical protein VM101_06415 [Flavitalea sp.]|nr:hypothetical protein [Flavitalea sp.]